MERISIPQACLLILGYLMGTAIILVPGVERGIQDAWLSPTIALVPGIILLGWLLWIRARYPHQDMVQISRRVLGSVIGTMVGIMWVLYFFILTVLVARNQADFANVFFVSTPDLVLVAILVAVGIYAVRLGKEVIVRFSELTMPCMLGIFVLLVILILPIVDLNQFRPLLVEGITPVLWGAVLTYAFPVGEIVVLASFLSNLKLKNSRQAIWLFVALALGAGVLALRTFAAVGVLGPAETVVQLFPVYSAFRQIDLFDVIQRVDILIIGVFVTTAYIKFFVCFYVTAEGIASLLKLPDYRIIVFPLALILAALIHVGIDSVFELLNFNTQIWPVISIVFAVILPVLLSIGVLMRSGNQSAKKAK